MFALSFSSRGRHAQEINSQLQVTGQCLCLLWTAIAGSLDFNNDFTSSFSTSGELPKKIPSVANYRKCLGLAVECNNRSTKSTLRFTLLFCESKKQCPRKKPQVAKYRTCFMMAAECNSRRRNSTLMFTR